MLSPAEQQAEQRGPEQQDSEYAVSGRDLLQEAVEDQDNALKLGDEGFERVRSERGETERPESGQEQEIGRGRAEQRQAQPEAQEQQAPEPTPGQVTEVLQQLDTNIQEFAASTPADASKFAAEIAPIMGADIYRDGWNVEALDRTVARTTIAALSVVDEVMRAGGDYSQIPSVSAPIAREVSRDVALGLGIDPRLNPIHDERLVANMLFFGIANILRTSFELGGETDPAKLNDGNNCVLYVQQLLKGISGADAPVNRQRAIQFVDALTRRVFGVYGKVSAGLQQREATQQRQGRGRSQRGQRVPAQFREAIKGSKAPRFKTNSGPNDPFNNQAMEDYAQRSLRL